MATTKRSNRKDDDRVTGEAPGTVDDEAVQAAHRDGEAAARTEASARTEAAAQNAVDATAGESAAPEHGELGTGVGHEEPADDLRGALRPTVQQTVRPSVQAPVQTASADTPQGHTSTLRLPFVTASFTRTSGGLTRTLPNPLDVVTGAGHVVGAVVSVVPGKRALFYTGVAALGVAGVVEWPVAAIVATGTYVASRGRRDLGARAGAEVSMHARAGAPTTTPTTTPGTVSSPPDA